MMIYTHVAKKNLFGIPSPVDGGIVQGAPPADGGKMVRVLRTPLTPNCLFCIFNSPKSQFLSTSRQLVVCYGCV